MIENSIERNILLFATEIKLLELKYGFSLGGDRAGNINICDEDGEKIKTLPNISIKKR